MTTVAWEGYYPPSLEHRILINRQVERLRSRIEPHGLRVTARVRSHGRMGGAPASAELEILIDGRKVRLPWEPTSWVGGPVTAADTGFPEETTPYKCIEAMCKATPARFDDILSHIDELVAHCLWLRGAGAQPARPAAITEMAALEAEMAATPPGYDWYSDPRRYLTRMADTRTRLAMDNAVLRAMASDIETACSIVVDPEMSYDDILSSIRETVRATLADLDDNVCGTYVKRPVAVSAWRCAHIIALHRVDPESLPLAVRDAIRAEKLSVCDDKIEVDTLEGTMVAKGGPKGDWLVQGVQGEFYPVAPDIFSMTYQAAAAAHGETLP